MSESRDCETTVIDLARSVLEDRRRRLVELGLEARVELERWQEPCGSEIRVTFWRGDTLVDFFEDFVVRDGELVSPREELARWLGASVDDVLQDIANS